MEKNTKFIVTDENGKEHECTILFTYEAPNKVNYVWYVLPDGETVVPSRYDEKGNLQPLETDEEWDMVEQIFETYMEEEYEEEEEDEESN